MFSPLSVCEHDYAKTTGCLTMKEPDLDEGADPDWSFFLMYKYV